MVSVAMVPGMRKANRRVHLIVRAKEKMEARLEAAGTFFFVAARFRSGF